jgi:hypothetical protein
MARLLTRLGGDRDILQFSHAIDGMSTAVCLCDSYVEDYDCVSDGVFVLSDTSGPYCRPHFTLACISLASIPIVDVAIFVMKDGEPRIVHEGKTLDEEDRERRIFDKLFPRLLDNPNPPMDDRDMATIELSMRVPAILVPFLDYHCSRTSAVVMMHQLRDVLAVLPDATSVYTGSPTQPILYAFGFWSHYTNNNPFCEVVPCLAPVCLPWIYAYAMFTTTGTCYRGAMNPKKESDWTYSPLGSTIWFEQDPQHKIAHRQAIEYLIRADPMTMPGTLKHVHDVDTDVADE